jgi:hypothetical protein
MRLRFDMVNDQTDQAGPSRRALLYGSAGAVNAGFAGCSSSQEGETETTQPGPQSETRVAQTERGQESLAVDDLRAGTAWSDLDTGHRSRLVTHQDEDIYVSVEDGDDENGGRSQDDAYQTINRALADVPKFCYHSISIHIDYGDYREQDGPRIFHIHQTARSREGHSVRGQSTIPFTGGGLKLWGHVEYNDYYQEDRSPEDVVFSYGLDSGCGGSEELTVWGITVDGRWQSYDSGIRFRNCVFKGGGGGPDGDKSLIGGHRSRAQFWGCDFKDAKNISHLGGMCFVAFQGDCGIENVDRPFQLWGGTLVYVHEVNWNLLEDPPKETITKNGAGWIMNHPRGDVQENGGTPRSRGNHTFDNAAVFSDTNGESNDVAVENRDGELVAIVDGEETTLT